MSCGICFKSLRLGNEKAIACNTCCNNFHTACVNLRDEEVKFFKENKESKWLCEKCTKDKRLSLTAESVAASGEDASISMVVKLLNQYREDHARMEKDIGKSLDVIHNDNEVILGKLDEQEKRLTESLRKIEEQSQEIVNLKSENVNLRRRVIDLEQYSRANNLEVHGIPMETNENVRQIVKSVSTALGHPIEENQVDMCHRLTARPGSFSPPPIIVRLISRYDKEAILQKRRVKRDFSTRHMGLPTDIPVFVNENLCPERRQIFIRARKEKIEKGYKYLWVRGGKVFVRKNDGDVAISLETIDDIPKIV